MRLNIQDRMSRYLFITLLLGAILIPAKMILGQELSSFHAQPDQVLVLYNADWTRDTDGSDPGQDSKEVAEYYQSRHTDPLSGKKPYLLGLHCIHKGEFHLNTWKLTELSQDNKDGIIYKGEGTGPGPGKWARDSRRVEIVINDKNPEKIDWKSVSFTCRSRSAIEKRVTHIRISGIPKKQGRKIVYPDIDAGKGRCYRFDAHHLFNGTVWVHTTANDLNGRIIKNLKIRYDDRDDFVFSPFGPDGIDDEKHFQEDVANPVKAFLEDPNHALSDGTLLKDHILYIVVCHGLPYACEAVFGIERGATSRPPDHGDLGSLEQRLQTLYYGWGTTIRPPVISLFMSGGPKSKDGVRNYRITSALRYPLVGKRWNPYMHPNTYSFLGSKKAPAFIQLQPFEKERKEKYSKFFAYGVTRIDGQGPIEAKRIIDYSVYASKFLRPEMQTGKKVEDLQKRLKSTVSQGAWGKAEISILGFNTQKKVGNGGLPFFARGDGYYPGGMDRKVISHNGWNMGRSAPIWNYIDHGVTVSACGGPAYGGGPHITNTTFWDNRILMRYLFRGRDLGECFLRSTYHVNWSISLVGDPLYHPDLNQTTIDTSLPDADPGKIRVDLSPAMEHYAAVIRVPIVNTPKNPEVSVLKIAYSKVGANATQESCTDIYSTEPYVYLRNLEPETRYFYHVELIDPYGNKRLLPDEPEMLSFKTGKMLDSDNIITRTAAKKGKAFEVNLLKMFGLKNHGKINVIFTAGKYGVFPSVSSKKFFIKTKTRAHKKSIRTEISLAAPKKILFLQSPLKPGEKATLVIRWRRFPLTREISLVATNGEEFLLAADTRTPWENFTLGLSMKIQADQSVKILSANVLNDSEPASEAACAIVVPNISSETWQKANQSE